MSAKKQSKKLEKKLITLRKEIDKTDREIAILCHKRLKLTRQVFKTKKVLALPSIDRKREQQITALFAKRIKLKSTRPRMKALVRALIQLNPQYPL